MTTPERATFRNYAAMQFYRMACRNHSIPIRWGVLREDLREKYLAEADAAVSAWNAEEEQARFNREELDRHVGTKKS